MLKETIGSILIVVVSIWGYLYYILTTHPELPKLTDTWWGENNQGRDDEEIRPFEIYVSDKVIQDLYLRLNMSREFTASLEGTQHQYGLNPKVLTDMIHFLKKRYNFTERQNFLNQYPQFTTQIQGLKLHFLHIKPKNPESLPKLPFLLLHGWPSSVREFYDMIPVLMNHTSNGYVFELIIPALPGFGYSESSRKPKLQSPQVSHIFRNLMKRLGHEKFYVHGSDWGAVVAASMATLYPENVLGFHSNFCFSLRYISIAKMALGSLYPRLIAPHKFENKLYPLSDLLKFYIEETGYMHIQATKPDTVGVGLDNSPEGLLAFLLEKLSVGTNKINTRLATAGLERFDKTSLLDIIMFYYWFPKTATTSARFYAENLNVDALVGFGIHNTPIDEKVPCGCAFFKEEFIYHPESILKDKYTNLIHYTTYESGGHFTALEETKLLVEDIISFVSKTRLTTSCDSAQLKSNTSRCRNNIVVELH